MSESRETRTPVSVAGLEGNYEHMEPAARNPQLVERVIAVSLETWPRGAAACGACG